MLHTFGWAIVAVVDADGKVTEVYPARVKFRGFDDKSETAGFIGLTQHLKTTIDELVVEAES